MNITIEQNKLSGILNDLFEKYKDKSICVIGTTCCGKSTLLKEFSYCRDMDSEIFPLLTEEEKAYVCQTPWTQEIGRKMDMLVKERIKGIAGRPVFGTVLIDSELIIYLNIEDNLLKERCEKRGASLEDALNMKKDIENEINSYTGSCIRLCIV